MPLYSFLFCSPHTALSLFWPIDLDMDEFIREDTAQTVQIWKKQESKENLKKKYKNAKSKGKHAYNNKFAFIKFRYNG